MKTLILYSSQDGQTQAIASSIASTLAEEMRCEMHDLRDAQDIRLENFDAVLIGASVRYGHFQRILHKFVRRNAEKLDAMPSALFTVNLTARKPEKRSPQTNAYTRKFLLASPWTPKLCAVFAGALRYPHYRWIDKVMIRFIMKLTGGETDTTKEIEYTDWEQVAHFAQDFARLAASR